MEALLILGFVGCVFGLMYWIIEVWHPKKAMRDSIREVEWQRRDSTIRRPPMPPVAPPREGPRANVPKPAPPPMWRACNSFSEAPPPPRRADDDGFNVVAAVALGSMLASSGESSCRAPAPEPEPIRSGGGGDFGGGGATGSWESSFSSSDSNSSSDSGSSSSSSD